MRLAPATRSASTGPMSMSSIVSAKSLPSVPTEWTVSASTPANGPRPTAATKISAKMRSGIARRIADQEPRRLVDEPVRRDVARGERREQQREDERGGGREQRGVKVTIDSWIESRKDVRRFGGTARDQVRRVAEAVDEVEIEHSCQLPRVRDAASHEPDAQPIARGARARRGEPAARRPPAGGVVVTTAPSRRAGRSRARSRPRRRRVEDDLAVDHADDAVGVAEASSGWWRTQATASPSTRAISVRSARTISAACGSRLATGSSARMTSGLLAERARDRDALRLAAGERVRALVGACPAGRRAQGGVRELARALPGKIRRESDRCSGMLAERSEHDVLERGAAPDEMDLLEDHRRACAAPRAARARARREVGAPQHDAPSSGSISRIAQRSRVDLPLPLAPSTTVSSPAHTSRSTPLRTGGPSAKRLRSPRTASAGTAPAVRGEREVGRRLGRVRGSADVLDVEVLDVHDVADRLEEASFAGIIGPESTPSSVSTSLSCAGVSFRSAFANAVLNAAGRSPRTVIGSFGIGAETQMRVYFDLSNWPAAVAVACCWLLTSAASTLPFVSASSEAGASPRTRSSRPCSGSGPP